MDIQGCACKYGVWFYATPYITHRGSKGPPFAQAENMLDQRISRTAKDKKISRMAISRFFNAQLETEAIIHLEVRHTDCDIPRMIYSRPVKSLAMTNATPPRANAG